MSSDRAAVAREVLTELLEFAYARAETVSDTRQFMRERYPAPPAPETVTVGGRAWARDVDGWWVHHSDISHDVCGPRSTIGEMCARIASDARVIAERDARIAELERERDDMSQRHTDVCEKWSDENRRRVQLTERIAAQEARIAELEKECVRLHGYIDVAQSEREKAWEERDAALRALREYQNGRAR